LVGGREKVFRGEWGGFDWTREKSLRESNSKPLDGHGLPKKGGKKKRVGKGIGKGSNNLNAEKEGVLLHSSKVASQGGG